MNLGRVPTGPLNSLIDRRSDPYTIYEETGDDTDWNGSSSLSATNTVAQIDVFNQRSRPETYPTGEVRETRLQGLMSVDEKTSDVTDGNCIVHGGQVFELTLDEWPKSTDTVVYNVRLEERTDLTPP